MKTQRVREGRESNVSERRLFEQDYKMSLKLKRLSRLKITIHVQTRETQLCHFSGISHPQTPGERV